jgi:hypothetical protein
MQIYRGSVLVLALFYGAALARAAPTVVELFTSQGCSSCPPADAYVLELAGRQDVLALTFHIDYWNDLGWQDPFSSSANTARQHGYARALRLNSVYTPQLVIGGISQYVGSDRASVGARLSRGSGADDADVPVEIRREGGIFHVLIGTAAQPAARDVLLVSYLRRAATPVGRGENRGRTLTEANIVRSLTVLGSGGSAPHEFRIDAKSLPADATDLAALLQAPGQGRIMGAAMLPLR